MKSDPVISIHSSAFYELLDIVLNKVGERLNSTKQSKWINTEEAMQMLHIRSKTTLLQLRNEGKIRYSQPQHKIILYDSESITKYIEKHAHNTF